MSLESKIEQLTKAVTLLTEAMTAAGVGASVVAPTVEKASAVVETVSTASEDSPSLTHDDLKATCLKVARTGKKAEVKEVLASYDALKAVDVPKESIAECVEKLEAL